jgi:hypothetical protein
LQSKEEISGMSSAKELGFAGKPPVTNPNTTEESSYKEHHDRPQAQKEKKKKKRV